MSTMSAAGAEASVAPLACSAVLTHHWLVRYRGGEKVLAALSELLPDAPVYTLVHDAAGLGRPDADATPSPPRWLTDSTRVRTSWLQHLPGARRHYPKLLPLMPLAARSVRLPAADLVVCSDAAIAKAMTPNPRSRVVCYCHSPMRYVWEPQIAREYRQTLPPPLRPLWGPLAAYLRRADRRAAAHVHTFVANSQHVAERIRRHYARDAAIVHPPIDLPVAPGPARREPFYLCVGHHVAYKRLDLAVAACRQLGRRLVVIGEGPDVERLRPTAGGDVTFLGWQPDAVMYDHYRRARALLFPGEEDFGIVPVEAMAHGCPVISYARGGATETVTDGRTGVFFAEQSPAALADAIRRLETLTFDPAALHADMQRFSRRRFLEQMRAVLADALAAPGCCDATPGGQ
jgi:glycosyltransferase involved in cell wall biosynthesis